MEKGGREKGEWGGKEMMKVEGEGWWVKEGSVGRRL